MSASEVIGFIAGSIGIISSLPQTIRIRRLGHAIGVSLPTWLIMYASTCSWLGYGLRTNSPAQWVTNGLASILIISVLYSIIGNTPRTYLLLLLIPGVFISLALITPTTLFSTLLVAFSATRLPQVVKSWQTWDKGLKSAVSLHMWLLSALSGILWLVYAVVGHRMIVETTASIGITLSLAIVAFEIASSRRFIEESQ